MKKFSVVLIAAMLLSVGHVFAKEVTKVDPSKSLSMQISQLLNGSTFIQNEVEQFAQVRFTLNNEHEIVVLSVESDSKFLEGFIKQRLNYQEVELDTYKEGQLYTISVRIEG